MLSMLDDLDLSGIQDQRACALIIRLLNLIEDLSADLHAVQEENQRLRDEINRLTGQQGKPDIKPNTPTPPSDHSSERERHQSAQRVKRGKRASISINREDFARLDPADLPTVTRPVECHDADLVLGSRGSHTSAMPRHARVANAALAADIKRRTGLRVSDLGPMRAARRDALLGLDLRDRRFGWPLEMVVRAARAGWRIHEVPVSYGPRVGRSKVTGTVRGSIRAARDMVRVLNADGTP